MQCPNNSNYLKLKLVRKNLKCESSYEIVGFLTKKLAATCTLLMYNQCQMFWISNDQYGEQSETLFGTVLGLQ